MQKKSFLISPSPLKMKDVVVFELENNLYLSAQRDLNVQEIRGSKSGTKYVLIGVAIQQDSTRPAPEVELQAEDKPVDECVSSWCGRWTLVAGATLYTDFAVLSGIFYAGRTASNSFSLMLDNLKSSGKSIHYKKNQCTYGCGIDYYPGPMTPEKEVMRLLPLQRLDLKGDKFEYITYAMPEVEHNNRDLTDELIDLITTFLKNAALIYGEVLLPLSGGYDSRTLFAIALKSGIDFSAYTCMKENISYADRNYPQRCCALFDIKHRWVRRSRLTRSQRNRRAEEFDRHTSGLCIDRDREYYVYKQLPPASKSAVVLGGAIWELLHFFYRSKFGENIDCNLAAPEIFSKFGRVEAFQIPMLERYLEYARDTPWAGVPFYHRFYLEQRVSIWLSAIEQAWDLNPAERIQPCNSQRCIALMLRLAREYPHAHDVQKEIMRRLAPQLLTIPFNFPQWSPLQRKTRRAISLVKQFAMGWI
ncbi:MAG: hypothetical protein PHI35_05415 [Victivallaceae bacterium]|nr:hypothetical protein [Victivallaceae bacterium]